MFENIGFTKLITQYAQLSWEDFMDEYRILGRGI